MKKSLLSLLAAGLVATVASPLRATDYEKVTSLEQVTDGDYLIACPEEGAVMGALGSTSKFFTSVTVEGLTAETTTITGHDDFTVMTIKKVDGGYELISGVKHFSQAAKNQLTLVQNDVIGSITEENGELKIFANPKSTNEDVQKSYIMYNSSNPRFAGYVGTQTAVTLFKAVADGGTVTPEPADGMVIKFVTGASDSSTAMTATTAVADVISEGAEYVTGFDKTNNVYPVSVSGIKFSSSKANGNVTLMLNAEYEIQSIHAVVAPWLNSKGAADSGVALTVNGQNQTIEGTEAQTLVYTYADAEKVDTITLNATKRLYVTSLTVVVKGGDVPPVVETVAKPVFTPAAGEVEAGTKVTISCATEGASLFYSLGDAEFAPYTAETEIVINEAATVRAKATKEGMNDSQVASAAYTIKVVINPDDLEGAGTEEKPYTVADVLTLNNTKKENAWVTGYIVGYISGMNFNEEGAKFDSNEETASETNLLLAPAADVNDWTKCIPVALPAGEIRSVLNLKQNPKNLGKKLEIYGSLEAYFKAPGVKSPVKYNLEGAEKPVYATVENIGEWLDEQPATFTTILQPVTVVYQNNLDLLIQDATGSLLVYGNLGGQTYENGDQLSGITGKLNTYKSLPQFSPVAATFGAPVGKADAVKPAVSTLADVNAANLAKYVSVAGVSIVEEDGKFYAVSAEGDAKVELYNRYKLENLAACSDATIVGFVWIFDTTLEIVLTEIIEGQTGIADITVDGAAAEVYDLTGRRVAAPVRGLYIINGKKVLVK